MPEPNSGPPPDQSSTTDGRPREILASLYALASLAYALWLIWAMVPEHQKTAIRLRLLRSCELATSRLARRTAALSLRHEARTGQQSYALAYALSCTRDVFRELYDRARDVSA